MKQESPIINPAALTAVADSRDHRESEKLSIVKDAIDQKSKFSTDAGKTEKGSRPNPSKPKTVSSPNSKKVISKSKKKKQKKKKKKSTVDISSSPPLNKEVSVVSVRSQIFSLLEVKDGPFYIKPSHLLTIPRITGGVDKRWLRFTLPPFSERFKDCEFYRGQIDGFGRVLTRWLQFHYSWARKSAPGILKLILVTFLSTHFSEVPLQELPKLFKLHLVTSFSIGTNQTVPPGGEGLGYLKLFPSRIRTRLLRSLQPRGRTGHRRRVRCLWSLMQFKTLSTSVPKEFKQAAYESHRSSMSDSFVTPPTLLTKFMEFIRPWADDVVRRYKDITSLPTNHAYYEGPPVESRTRKEWDELFYDTSLPRGNHKYGGKREWKRSEGGCHAALIPRFGRPRPYEIIDTVNRMAPVVLHLQGLPGIGKSTILSRLSDQISRIFQLEPRKAIFSRNASCKHWDGFRPEGNLITQIDDFMSIVDAQSIADFISMISNVTWRPPMAALHDKGVEFRSNFVFLNSNRGFHKSSQVVAEGGEAGAYMRRLKNTYVLERHCMRDGDSRPLNITLPDFNPGVDQYDLLTVRKVSVTRFVYTLVLRACSQSDIVRYLTTDTLKKFEDATFRHHKSLSMVNGGSTWDQEVGLSTEERMFIRYPLSPPPGLNHVMTHAIEEPLKIRMITKAHPYAWSLKPLQQQMFRSLRNYDCFEPCWNPSYSLERLERHRTDDTLFLSGDYKSATDCLHMDISRAAITVLSDGFREIGREEIVRALFWEGGSHIVNYPTSTGLSPVIQTNGQLMGSLLSFPILCLVNAFIVSEACGSGLKDLPALIHGDDVAATLSSESISRWFQFGSDVGLTPSIGKTYTSKRWVAIDSQVFYFDHPVASVTGEVSLPVVNEEVKSSGSDSSDSEAWFSDTIPEEMLSPPPMYREPPNWALSERERFFETMIYQFSLPEDDEDTVGPDVDVEYASPEVVLDEPPTCLDTRFTCLKTGKVGAATRFGSRMNFSSNDCLNIALESGFTAELLRSMNKHSLVYTPRSLDVPVSHGGLGLSFAKSASDTAVLVYLQRRVSKLRVEVLKNDGPRTYIKIPHRLYNYLCHETLQERIVEQTFVDSINVQDVVDKTDLQLFSNFRQFWKPLSLEDRKALCLVFRTEFPRLRDAPDLEKVVSVTIVTSTYTAQELQFLSLYLSLGPELTRVLFPTLPGLFKARERDLLSTKHRFARLSSEEFLCLMGTRSLRQEYTEYLRASQFRVPKSIDILEKLKTYDWLCSLRHGSSKL
jgi:hypothetical protein